MALTETARLSLLLALLLVLGACRPAPEAPKAPQASVLSRPSSESDTLRIGAIFNLGLDGAPHGPAQREGATLAVDVINARGGIRLKDGSRRPLELLIYDGDGVTARTALAMRSLAEEDGVLAVVGPSEPEPVRSAAAIARAAGVSLVALADSPDHLRRETAADWTFSLALSEDQAFRTLAEFIRATGARRLGWIAPRTKAAADVRSMFGELAAGTDRSIVGDEEYSLTDGDLDERVGRLGRTTPDAIVGWPHAAEDAADLARAAAERAPRSRLYLGPAATAGRFVELAGEGARGVRAPGLRLLVADDLWDQDSLTPAVRDFGRAFRLRYGSRPLPAAAMAWDAVRVIAAALERSSPDRPSVRDALGATDAFPGATGQISFSRSQAGLDQRAFIVMRAAPDGWHLPP